MAEFASKGVAGSGLGLGIAGTALGLLNNNGGLMGTLFGNGSAPNGSGYVTEKEQFYINEVNKRDAELAQAKSERYADNVGIEAYKEAIALSNKNDQKLGDFVEKVNTQAITTAAELAVLKSNIECLNQKLDYEIKATRNEMACKDEGLDKDIRFTRHDLEQQIACTYNTLNEKFNCYVPWSKKLSADVICPQPMARYNSWTAPTTETTTTP
jgi:hypothetical protein